MFARLFLVISTVAAVLPSACAADASVLGRPIGEWKLSDYRGKAWTSAEFADRPVQVVAFLGVECPLAKLYAPVLQRIADDYERQGVAVFVLDANRHDSLTEMAAFARQTKLNLPFLKDLNNVIADRLGAQRTPEVFVLDHKGIVRYHGRIDDQHAIGGRSRPEPTRHDLKSAVEDLLAGRSVAVAETEAMGCLIGKAKSKQPDATVTYAEHIAPLLQAHCVECHRAGEIGPFSLTDYEETAGWAAMIAEVTREQRMPPWHADPRHGDFVNANRLTDKEVELFQAWSAAGAPAGDLSQAPPPREFTTGWQLPREPDLVVAMAGEPFHVPAAGEVRYQYFSVDPGLTEDKWLSAAEIVPGNRAIVHHVIVFAAPGGKVTDDDGQMVTAYVPGMRVRPLPEGYAKRIPAGCRFIFQLHYTPNGTAQDDLTKIGLTFVDPEAVEYEVQTASARSRSFEIAPYKADQAFASKSVTAPIDLQLLSLSPHMHLRGQSFRYEMMWPNGQTETLLDVPHYDFNWQTSYRFREPLEVPKGSRLTAFATYDNSKENLANPDPSQTVVWGDQSWEEMLIGYFDIAIPRQEGKSRNVAAEVRRQGAVGEVVAKRLLKTLDRDGDGKVQRSEVSGARLEAAFAKVDEDRDGVVTIDELTRNLPKLRDNQ
ncbi:MAG: redoxin domain-containing protein [Planctomycetaceae bacterium]|nr:redoxin domain-containing protein [Planctomycetaceae bacterium]